MPRRSFTLVEAVISTVLVGIMLVAAINTLGATAVSKRNIEHQALGYTLAADLMAEILSQAYEEPDDKPEFGRESSESSGDREDWDDVDDYDGWSATPPETKDEVELDGYDQWTRSVEVAFVKPTNLNELGASTGVKRITVTVAHNTVPVAELVTIRTAAWPVDKKDDSLKVLLVVSDDSNPSVKALARQALMESWGFTVTLIKASDLQSNFDTAVANADVAYVSEEISAWDLGTKLTNAAIGVVNEKPNLVDELGFGQESMPKDRLDIQIVDNSHYITSELTLGMLTICSSLQSMSLLTGGQSPDLQVLGETFNVGSKYKSSLATLSAGDALWDVGNAAGRRVQLPWGYSSFDIHSLNTDGQTLMKRSIEWAANKEQP